VRELPLLLAGPLVREVLADRKTQTRRLPRFQPAAGVRRSPFYQGGFEDGHGREIKVPWEASDRLYVRETWRGKDWGFTRPKTVIYKASDDFYGNPRETTTHPAVKWKPSIHMPKWAARIWLEVTEVRLQRLQQMTEADACAEGMGLPITRDCKIPKFARLWDSIYGKQDEDLLWKNDPWVFAVTFKRIKCR
jgi:hypothetical protein